MNATALADGRRFQRFAATFLSACAIAFLLIHVDDLLAQEIGMAGPNGVEITNGTTVTSEINGTHFGTWSVSAGQRTIGYVVHNLALNSTMHRMAEVTVTGTHAANFIISYQPATQIVSGANTYGESGFGIQFDPSANGLHTATVTVFYNDADEPAYTFKITGTGGLEFTAPNLNTSTVHDLEIVPNLKKNIYKLKGKAFVFNSGPEPAAGGTMSIYVSSDPILDAADLLLDTATFKSLKAYAPPDETPLRKVRIRGTGVGIPTAPFYAFVKVDLSPDPAADDDHMNNVTRVDLLP
jgi:hypothetical protein